MLPKISPKSFPRWGGGGGLSERIFYFQQNWLRLTKKKDSLNYYANRLEQLTCLTVHWLYHLSASSLGTISWEGGYSWKASICEFWSTCIILL